MLKQIFRNLFVQILLIVGLVILGIRTYDYLYSNQDLLSKETCLKYVEDDVLGKKLYSETCPRSSYLPNVDLISDVSAAAKSSGGFAFKFHPIPGKENACPALTIVVSRHTGEAWITDVEKQKKE